MQGTQISGRRMMVAALLVAVAVWLPRAFKLDQFVTVDESKWLVRSANFYEAMANGHVQHTFQHGHPGVMIMWAGTAGYLWKFPDYAQVAPGQFNWTDESFDNFVAERGYRPIDLLAAGRVFVVLMGTIALAVAFVYTARLLGLMAALFAFALIAFDPFQSALSRFMHPDSLLSTFMLLSAVAYLGYLYNGRRRRDLLVSAAAAALTLLTKTPGVFLLPLVGLFGFLEAVIPPSGAADVADSVGEQRPPVFSFANAWRVVGPLLVWLVVASVIYVALWPALWVAPRDTLAQVLDISQDYAEQGHSSPVFFAGQIFNGDPGFWFYPINYLWRTTPVALLGLALLVVALLARSVVVRTRSAAMTVLAMAMMVVWFFVFMNLGAKKFDRYFLPVFMPLDVLAGVGWAALAGWIARPRVEGVTRSRMGYALAALVVVVAAAQAAFSLPTFPYYMSYYNPLLGGGAKAPEVMFIGWGEGLDEAARYLNETVDPATTHVASWYPHGPFSYFYEGRTDSNRAFWNADYAVIYNHQWQRELPSRRMMAYFSRLEPVHTVAFDGIEFARVYDMREAPPSEYTVDFGEGIRLVYYDTFSGAMLPGQKWDMSIYFVKRAPIEKNLNMIFRLVNQDGYELLRQEGWPNGAATSKWQIGEILRDNSYEVEITEETPPGIYRMELTFYDPATFDHLPVTSASTGEMLSDPYVLDYLIVGEQPTEPLAAIDPPADLGGKVALYGADFLDEAGQPRPGGSGVGEQSFDPGETVRLRLYWRGESYMTTDYTAFVHLVGPDGTLAAQADQRPLGGFLPTSYWPPHQVIVDDYTIEIPEDVQPGDYRLHAGMYDLATVTRLPIVRAGEPVGDNIVIGSIDVTNAVAAGR